LLKYMFYILFFFPCLIYSLILYSPSTQELTTSFGWSSEEAFEQHDVQELCVVMLDNLSEKLRVCV
jgi:hypothetical protein